MKAKTINVVLLLSFFLKVYNCYKSKNNVYILWLNKIRLYTLLS